MSDFYIIVRGTQTAAGVTLHPASSPYKHPTEREAKAEADRLAKISPGDMFFVMHAIGFARVQRPSTWFALDEIPF